MKRPIHASIEYEWECDDLTYTFRITGEIVPYVPASMYGGRDRMGWPAEGGEVENIEVELTGAYNEDGDEIEVPVDQTNIEGAFEDEMGDPALRECIEELLRIDADARCEEPDHRERD